MNEFPGNYISISDTISVQFQSILYVQFNEERICMEMANIESLPNKTFTLQCLDLQKKWKE